MPHNLPYTTRRTKNLIFGPTHKLLYCRKSGLHLGCKSQSVCLALYLDLSAGQFYPINKTHWRMLQLLTRILVCHISSVYTILVNQFRYTALILLNKPHTRFRYNTLSNATLLWRGTDLLRFYRFWVVVLFHFNLSIQRQIN